jgi:ankyrin repeat protein
LKLSSNVFIYSASRRYPEVVKELLLNGANANAKNSDGDTALYWGFNNLFVEIIIVQLCVIASFFGRIKSVKELLLNGADINATNNHGTTPLICGKFV